jgi:hypothetical protein
MHGNSTKLERSISTKRVKACRARRGKRLYLHKVEVDDEVYNLLYRTRYLVHDSEAEDKTLVDKALSDMLRDAVRNTVTSFHCPHCRRLIMGRGQT